MALSAKRYFSRGRIAFGASIPDAFDKFEQVANPKYHVGFRAAEIDGSVYRYGHFGATANRGVLVSTDVSESFVPDKDNAIIAPASAVTTSDGTIGSKFMQITIASVSANDFAGGKFITTDDTGEGYTYDIAGNTATGNPATGDIRLEIYQPLQVAVDNTTDFSIVSNLYHNLEIATTTDEVVVGVTCSTISAADNYAWLQSKGVVGILQDGTIAIGDPVTLSDGVSGAVQTIGGGGTDAADLTTEPIIGFCVDPGDNTGHGAFWINLD